MIDLQGNRVLSVCRVMALRWLLPLAIPGLALDAALDGPPAEFTSFIHLMHRLDTAGRYLHSFQVYEVAEHTGDDRLNAALKDLNPGEIKALASDLAEARGWLKRDKTFGAAFPRASARLRGLGIKVDF